jgi:hypothetical protein
MARRIKPIRIEGNLAYVPLSQGLHAIIDAEDAEFIGQWNWSAKRGTNTFYAVRTITISPEKQKVLRMHRIIIDAKEGLEVDHINRNGIDNRRSNLRLVTHQENAYNVGLFKSNSSGATGVYWDKNRNKWQAKIKKDQKNIFLGRFETKEEAINAWGKAKSILHVIR